MIPSIETIGYLALLALGFGFVIFWHELGHFLAAKWAGVRVEQFAVGFAHAVVSWRKGIGVRLGSTQKEYRARILKHLDEKEAVAQKGELQLKERIRPDYTDSQIAQVGDTLGLGETEYRLNWLPLGGYVKMMGQDDLRPNAEIEDPKAYNRKSVGARMVIVSAGVVMNIILAAIGFVVLFSFGFHVPPTKVGSVLPGSPYQLAGGEVGDTILELDDKPQYNDYTKIQLNAALAKSNQDIPVKVLRTDPDGKQHELLLTVKPQKADAGGGATLVALGIGPSYDLAGPDPDKVKPDPKGDADLPKRVSADFLAIKPGDKVTAVVVDGKTVPLADLTAFDREVQKGRPVEIVVKRRAGGEDRVTFTPSFVPPFGAKAFDLLGLVPRQQIMHVQPDSAVLGKVLPGDVLVEVAIEGTQDPTPVPSFESLRRVVNDAAKADKKVRLKVARGGQLIDVPNVAPMKIQRDVYGLGVGPDVDETAAVVSEVMPNTPAAAAGVPPRSTILKVGDRAVTNWRDVHVALRDLAAANPAGFQTTLDVKTDGDEVRPGLKLTLAKVDVDAVRNARYAAGLALAPTIGLRKADGVGEAVKFGLVETRDFILQFYVTLKRMATNDVSPANLMGPVGIFQTGTTIASRGPDWLLWFLAMISANLAVVNFLPIPIVDGGLFTFLLIEKIKGRPASPKVQTIAQYVGLVLLLSIFVFVTYQDIANFAFRMR